MRRSIIKIMSAGISMLLLFILSLSSALAVDRYINPASQTEGDGSREAPWRDLQRVVDRKLINSGDRLILAGGSYGRLHIKGLDFPERTIFEAASDGQPVFETIEILRSRNLVLNGLTVTSGGRARPEDRSHIRIDKHSRDITISDSRIFTVEDASGWTAADWDEKSMDGILSEAEFTEARNNLIRNVRFGIAVHGNNSVVIGNEVVNFAGDGLRGLGDYSLFEDNVVKNCYQVNSNHADGFQSWSVGPDGKPATGVIRGVTLRRNLILNYEDFHQPYVCKLQGIGLFGGVYEDWTIENNIVIVNNWHGITAYGLRASRIVNNTVVEIDFSPPGPAAINIISDTDGIPEMKNLLINNIAPRYSIEGEGVDRAGNLEIGDFDDVFIDMDKGDYRLPDGSDAIDAGVEVQNMTQDYFGNPRPVGKAMDAGAVERQN